MVAMEQSHNVDMNVACFDENDDFGIGRCWDMDADLTSVPESC